MKILYKNSTGADVKKMQSALNRAGASLTVDGNYGSKTVQAVKNFQEDNGLIVDGVCGPKTWDKLSPYMQDFSTVTQAVEECLEALENLPEYKRLEELLYG
jgi:g-D-glutamyl-meso-diaminopimelate peptidase